MKYIQLGTRNFPAIGLSTYKLVGTTATNVILKAIELGYRHIDTAQLYENEAAIGAALEQSGLQREEFYLTTKVWPSNLSEERFLRSVKESLRLLKVDHVDLLLIHWPHHQHPVRDYIQRLIQAQESGLATEIGVSNFNVAQLNAALQEGARIVTNQVEFHPWVNQEKLRNFMLSKNIALTSYSPFGQGKWLGNKKLAALAATYLRTPAQIILRWMMQKENILAIPKSSQPSRLTENLHVFDFELSTKDMEIIDAWKLSNMRIVDAQEGADWDT